MITLSIVLTILAIGFGIRKLALMIAASLRKAAQVDAVERAPAAQ